MKKSERRCRLSRFAVKKSGQRSRLSRFAVKKSRRRSRLSHFAVRNSQRRGRLWGGPKGGSNLWKPLAGDRRALSRKSPTNPGPGVFSPKNVIRPLKMRLFSYCREGDYFMNTSMNLQRISVDRLKPAKYNPRKDLKPGDPA